MRQHSIPSIFIFYEKSTHTTLSKTIVVDTLDVWILDSAERNLDLFHIRLLLFVSISKTNTNESGLACHRVTPRGRDNKKQNECRTERQGSKENQVT